MDNLSTYEQATVIQESWLNGQRKQAKAQFFEALSEGEGGVADIFRAIEGIASTDDALEIAVYLIATA